MQQSKVTVVVPTLARDPAVMDCLDSLERQNHRDFEVIVVDNSGNGAARALVDGRRQVRLIVNKANVGFGAAINQGIAASDSPFVAALNDDAVADTRWLAEMVAALRDNPKAGMCASQVRLMAEAGGEPKLDSAGMLIAGDGSSKQRGHLQPPEAFKRLEPVLCPSGSASLYRRAMLDEVGLFDESFFLYCEDTDLGLRAQWSGWQCLYVPAAIVDHHYSKTAGRASALKAYYVERNRLYLVVKCFPFGRLAFAPLISIERYLWHLLFLLRGQGKAAEFGQGASGLALPWYVVRAHASLLFHLPRLLAERRRIRKRAKLSKGEFNELLDTYAIRPEEVAAL